MRGPTRTLPFVMLVASALQCACDLHVDEAIKESGLVAAFLFDPGEHCRLGQDGVGSADVAEGIEICPGLTMTPGEAVALGGDLLRDEGELASLAGSSKGREQLSYLRSRKLGSCKSRHRAKNGSDRCAPTSESIRTTMPAFKCFGDPRTIAECRFYALAADNGNHFPCPRLRDSLLPAHMREGSAGKEYRRYHEAALLHAIDAGRKHLPLDAAYATEAFGWHFYTDALSGGHIRTPRLDVEEYWDRVVPDFDSRFALYLADHIAVYTLDENWWARTYPEQIVEEARKQVRTELQKFPALTFGRLVALAIHDFDNCNGVKTDAGIFMGDGVMDAFTAGYIAGGLRQSADEIRAAYRAGKTRDAAMAPGSILAELRDQSGRYAAETRLLPCTVGGLPLPWSQPSVVALLQSENMRWALNFAIRSKIQTLVDVMPSSAKKAVQDSIVARVMRGGAECNAKSSSKGQWPESMQVLIETVNYDGHIGDQIRDTWKDGTFPFGKREWERYQQALLINAFIVEPI